MITIIQQQQPPQQPSAFLVPCAIPSLPSYGTVPAAGVPWGVGHPVYVMMAPPMVTLTTLQPRPAVQISQGPPLAADFNILQQLICFHCKKAGHKAIHCPDNPAWCGETSALCSVHNKVRSRSSLMPKGGDKTCTEWECTAGCRCR